MCPARVCVHLETYRRDGGEGTIPRCARKTEGTDRKVGAGQSSGATGAGNSWSVFAGCVLQRGRIADCLARSRPRSARGSFPGTPRAAVAVGTILPTIPERSPLRAFRSDYPECGAFSGPGVLDAGRLVTGRSSDLRRFS